MSGILVRHELDHAYDCLHYFPGAVSSASDPELMVPVSMEKLTQHELTTCVKSASKPLEQGLTR